MPDSESTNKDAGTSDESGTSDTSESGNTTGGASATNPEPARKSNDPGRIKFHHVARSDPDYSRMEIRQRRSRSKDQPDAENAEVDKGEKREAEE